MICLSEYTGISFPFRIGNKGGVAMSTTSYESVPHIIEAIKQILLTRPNERGMEYNFKSDIDTDIFEPNDESTRTLVEYQVREALRELEDRIEVEEVNVTSRDNEIWAEITFTVLKYNKTFSTDAKVGEM